MITIDHKSFLKCCQDLEPHFIDDESHTITLLSIHHQYASLIFDSSKKFEFRKSRPTIESKTYLIYETAPIKMITGAFISSRLLSMKKSDLWNHCSTHAGISKQFFEKYFKDKQIAHAIQIDFSIKFKSSIQLNTLSEYLKAPQSYLYINVQ